MTRVSVPPKMLVWACERAGRDWEHFADRIPQLPAWIRGEARPTLRQLEKLARATHTPFGYLFLPNPPEERLPLPDYRTLAGGGQVKPSPDLLETLYTMQRRQDWLRELLIEEGAEPLHFVGSAALSDPPGAVGREMLRTIGLDGGWAAETGSWRDAVSALRRAIERVDVMAVINGVVGNNRHRRLNVREFCGFALTDSYAPLIFVNGADAESAQTFTLVHELAHVWLGREGLSGFEALGAEGTEVEEWCCQAAAEFLLPTRELLALWSEVRRKKRPFSALGRRFKVSPLVACRRAVDLELVDRRTFLALSRESVGRGPTLSRTAGGGNFCSNQGRRVGEYFARHVLGAALEGRIGFKQAYDLTGLGGAAFRKYAKRLGVDLP